MAKLTSSLDSMATVGMKSIYRMSDAPPNWAQDDPTQPDYIKNKDQAEKLRPIYVNGEQMLDDTHESGPLNLVSGRNVELAVDGNNVIISTKGGGGEGPGGSCDCPEIVEGDGNDNTTYEFEVCEHKTGIVITPLFNGQPIMEGEGEETKQVKYHLDLDVYTKAEVDAAIKVVADSIDFTPYAKTEDVAKTYATIDALNAEAERADAAEKVNAKVVADLAAGAVKKNTDDIAAINALLNTVDSEDTITSLKELAIWVEEHDTEIIPVINEHTEAIEALEGKMTAVETAVNTTLPNAIAQALVDAKTYTDEKMVKADGTSIVNNEGTFSVGAVSTDNLVQGTMTLVLNGGDAKVTA